jgi:hypothetical protein
MRHLPQQTILINSYRTDVCVLWADCWLELQWVQTYSSTRSLCSTERSNTPAAQYLEDVNFVRAGHNITRTTAAGSTCEILPVSCLARRGPNMVKKKSE